MKELLHLLSEVTAPPDLVVGGVAVQGEGLGQGRGGGGGVGHIRRDVRMTTSTCTYMYTIYTFVPVLNAARFVNQTVIRMLNHVVPLPGRPCPAAGRSSRLHGAPLPRPACC